jgi:hypothetical protein
MRQISDRMFYLLRESLVSAVANGYSVGSEDTVRAVVGSDPSLVKNDDQLDEFANEMVDRILKSAGLID